MRDPAADAQRPLWVVIPAYNASGYVARAVGSALKHTGPDRVLVIDDGSTDNTARCAEAAGALVIGQANAGPSVARNRGFDLAESHEADALTIDADDEFLPGAIDAFRRALQEAPEAPVVLGNFNRVNPRAKLNVTDMLWPHVDRLGQNPVAALLPWVPVTGSGVLVRHQTLAAGLRQSTRMHVAEDRDFIFRACRESRLAVTRAPVFRKHDVPGQMTKSPHLAQRFLVDVLHLVETHSPGLDEGHRAMLAPMVQHYLKQACRQSAKQARRMDQDLWHRAERTLASLGSGPHWRTRKWYWASRAAGLFRGAAPLNRVEITDHQALDAEPEISVVRASHPSARPRA